MSWYEDQEAEMVEMFKENFKTVRKQTLENLINYLKHNPGYFEEIKEMDPFDHPDFKNVDWTKVESFEVKDDVLVLKMVDE